MKNYIFSKPLTLFFTSLFLISCGTNTPSWPHQEYSPGTDEIVLADPEPYGYFIPNSRCCGKAGELQIRIRFSEKNYAYRVAYSPLSNQHIDKDRKYRLTINYSNVLNNLDLGYFDFSEAEKITDKKGNTYYLTPWLWSPEPYIILNKPNSDYVKYFFANAKHLTSLTNYSLRNFAYWRTHEGPTKAMSLGIYAIRKTDNTTYMTRKAEQTLQGEAAFIAATNPEVIYAEYFALPHQAKVEHLKKKNAVKQANKEYQKFVRKNFTALSLFTAVKNANCPNLPYMLRTYDAPNLWYAEGDLAVKRAECLSETISTFSPQPLIKAYERLSADEAALFNKTYGIERFSLESIVEESESINAQIQTAVARANALYDGGDHTGQVWAKQREEQARKTRTMQSLVQGLQSVNQTIREQNRQTNDQLKKLQAQVYTRSAPTTLDATSNIGSSNIGSSKIVPTNEPSIESQGTDSTPKSAVYLAASSLKSNNVSNCDLSTLSTTRLHEVKCSVHHLIKLPAQGSITAQRCGKEKMDQMEAWENITLGAVVRVDAVTRTEFNKMRSRAEAMTQPIAGVFVEQDPQRAEAALIEWAVDPQRQERNQFYFRNKTEIRSEAIKHNCKAIEWTNTKTKVRTLEPISGAQQ